MALLNEHIDGKYEILGKLREGGMGAIYKVRHRLLDEIRVVKVIRSQAEQSGEAADRFLHEAKAAIRLRHPNVAVLYDFAVADDGQAFIVMEYIDGWNLLEVLGGYGPPPVGLTLEIARQSLKALGYLHRHRIVHRDVSPDNLMLTRDVEGNPLVKLIDLGIVKALEGHGGLTTTGVFLGKPRYGSPERFGGGASDARSDLYSFGVVLYELLTGRAPITGNEPAALMAGHLFRAPLDFSETDPEGRVPAELRALVLKALAKKPDERMASAEDFVWELTMLQDRFPLSHEDLESVWSTLLPLSAAGGASVQEPAGSTQDRINLELGAGATPPTGLLTGEATVRVTPRETLSTLASPEPARRITASEDLDATWASRPLRVGRIEEPPAAPVPAPAVPLRGAVVAKPAGLPKAWLAAGLAVLALAAGGFWWSRSPAPAAFSPAETPPAETSPIVPDPPPAAPRAPAVPAAETPKPPAESTPAAGPAPGRPAGTRRSPLPEEPAAAPGPLEPMKPGDLIRAGQPGVEAPEIREWPNYGYPEAARGSGRKVSVRVGVLVDEAGSVIDARVREGDESAMGFDEIALVAARKARFFPATRDGVPGKMWTELLLEFAE